MKWAKRQLSDEYDMFIKNGYNRITASVLCSSGIKTLAKADEFLNSVALNDTNLMKNIEKVSDTIFGYVFSEKKICIFGDYDADGVTSSSIMFLALEQLGANVCVRLPDRINEGYGISMKAIKEQLDNGVELFITVDNGIKAISEIQFARDNGADVVVLDHHQPSTELPNATAMIDLYIPDETYPFIDLTGAGLAWKVAKYILDNQGYSDFADSLIDLAAIGTIADVAKLVGENRVIVKRAIEYMRSPMYNRLGIISLLNDDITSITAETIAFRIAPCINASGRLKENGADLPLSLVLEKDKDKAIAIAKSIVNTNLERKKIQAEAYAAIKPAIDIEIEKGSKVLVLFSKTAPSGVVGLLAGNIREDYNRPTIVFSEKKDIDGNAIWTGSARSIEQYNMLDEITKCADCFIAFGGHALAAGMSIEASEEKLEELRTRLNASCTLTDDDIEPVKYWDIDIKSEDVNDSLVNEIEKLEPFGEGCRRPVLKLCVDTIPNASKLYDTIGETAEHLKLFCKGYSVIGFRMVSRYENDNIPRTLDAIGYVDRRFFNGNKYFQFVMDDYHPINKEDTELKGTLHNLLSMI